MEVQEVEANQESDPMHRVQIELHF